MSGRVAFLGRGLALTALAAGCWHSAQSEIDAGDGAPVPGDSADSADGVSLDANDGQACSGARVDRRCRIALATGEALPYNLAVNTTHLYWTTQGIPIRRGTVMRIALAGGPPEELATGANPHTIVLDDTSVYWTDFTRFTGAIMKMPLDGGTPVRIVGLQDNPHGLAVDQSSVYWTNFDGMQIRKASKVPPDGGTSTFTDLALIPIPMSPNNLIVDDTFVYWTEWVSSGKVMKTRIDGASPSPLVVADTQDHPYGVVLDRTNIYWTNSEGGQVMKMPLSGHKGDEVALASGQVQPFGLAVDETNVYWANYAINVPNFVGQVRSVPIAGGDVTELSTATSYAVAVDGNSVYWTTYASGTFDGAAIEGGQIFKMTPK